MPGCAVTNVSPNQLQTRDGHLHEANEILWTTEASAAPWLAGSGLAVDDRGFVRVARTLQSTSHPEVFAAGGVASMIESPRPKSGVFAVRQGAALARNLRNALLGERLRPYHPQRQSLSLISTGDKYAVASRGPFAFGGRWVWRWKDRIDRAFMRSYQELPDMQVPGSPVLPSGLLDADATAMVSAPSFRCGGCGAKVGASVLAGALQRVAVAGRDDVLIGLDDPDDAAVIAAADGTSLVHTIDFFRAIIDDPYVFGQIAANHALGDIYAMGAEPQSALALVTLPYGPEAKVEDTLTHLLAGASNRDAAGCLLSHPPVRM